MDGERLEQLHRVWKSPIDTFGDLLIEIFHYLALFVIGASVVWSGLVAYAGMMLQGHATRRHFIVIHLS